MKLRHIVEAREYKIPVEVIYEYPREIEGEIEYIDVVVELDVYVTPDHYGTGDSPTRYYPEIIRAYDKQTKEPLDWRKFPKKDIEWIEDKAIEIAMDSL